MNINLDECLDEFKVKVLAHVDKILEQKNREIAYLENLIFSMTHHEGALEETKEAWVEIVDKFFQKQSVQLDKEIEVKIDEEPILGSTVCRVKEILTGNIYEVRINYRKDYNSISFVYGIKAREYLNINDFNAKYYILE